MFFYHSDYPLIIYLPRKNTLNGRFNPHHVRGPNPIPLSLWLLVPKTVSHLAGRRNGLGSEQVEAAERAQAALPGALCPGKTS